MIKRGYFNAITSIHIFGGVSGRVHKNLGRWRRHFGRAAYGARHSGQRFARRFTSDADRRRRICGDLFPRHCNWGILLRLFPSAALGILIGYFAVDVIPVEVFEKVIGATILFMLGFELLVPAKRNAPMFLTVFVGIFAGFATMVANAAGPIFGVYLLQMGLPKDEFVGTRSWYFLILNVFKVPFSANLGLITFETLKLNLMFVPVIFVGAYLGYKFLGMLNMNAFKWLIRAAVLISVTKLLLF